MSKILVYVYPMFTLAEQNNTENYGTQGKNHQFMLSDHVSRFWFYLGTVLWGAAGSKTTVLISPQNLLKPKGIDESLQRRQEGGGSFRFRIVSW